MTFDEWAEQQQSKAKLTRIQELEKALQELCDLKDRKDSFGKDRVYTKRQPLAWSKARKLLSNSK